MFEKEYVLGLDISTSCVGITVMDTSDKLIKIGHIKFPVPSKKIKKLSLYEKAIFFKKEFKEFENYNFKHLFIEAPMRNGPDIGTIILLAEFNAIISNFLYEKYNKEPIHIDVYNARKIFFPEFIVIEKKKSILVETLSFPKHKEKKQLVFDKVSWLEPQTEWVWNKLFNLTVENFDRADSYVIAKAGLFLEKYILEIPICPILLN